MTATNRGPPADTSFDERIIAYLGEGKNPNEVAKLIGKDRGFVIRAANRHRAELSDTISKYLDGCALSMDAEMSQALDASSKYLKSEDRQELLSKTLNKMAEMIESCKDTRSLRDLCVCAGILIDKFAVEQGKTDDKAKSALVQMFEEMKDAGT